MAKQYDHKKLEKKHQGVWLKSGIYNAKDNSTKEKFFPLVEFPFPSGAGLHIGHPRSYTAIDIIARKRRMEGYNVLYPIGWDAFGLPTENYAIKTGIQPKIVTKQNTDNFRKQLQALGLSFDWSREINTTDPEYYRWTQWIFLKMYEKGLAYKSKMFINWCPKDKVGLANEEVINGCCERCGTQTEKREKEQWMLAITKYADRLYKDLDDVNYIEQVKIQQRNWIGRSEGAEINFELTTNNQQLKKSIKVFTTRPDTLFGVTYVVLAPESVLLTQLLEEGVLKNSADITKYKSEAKKKTDIERTDAKKEKTGLELVGIKAINPANKEEVPVFVADYVLADYGTGAVMAVPAHDERDWEFAKKYELPIREVVIPRRVDHKNPHVEGKETVFRKGILGIVWNPRTKKYLCLKWKKQPWTTFVVGGIEDNESPEEAARREIKEETGYVNLHFKKVLGGPIQTEFYAAHKGINRIAHSWYVVFDLKDDEKIDVSDEENEKHEIVWFSQAEITKDVFSHAEMEDILARMDSPMSAYAEKGILIDSGTFSGKNSEDVKKDMGNIYGKWMTTYKLRDWVFSRQRYWGEPIPMIHCESCGWVPVPEKDLPVKLPAVKKYEPTDNGESPLSLVSSWVKTKCPKCKGPARRETDTMPNWAGSSWYYLRYTDPKNKKAFADKKKLEYWLPIDWYNGGMEHTTLHLLYSRFWHKFLYDIGYVPTSEPYQKRTSHGMILGEGGVKMSKSLGNVVNPDDVVKAYGADTFRVYEMFIGPFAQSVAWSTESIIGSRRFIERIWKLAEKVSKDKKYTNTALETILHKTIKKVGEDIETMGFNTAVSSMMILVSAMEKQEQIGKGQFETFLKILAPFAPHITEELWLNLGNKKSIHISEWPQFDADKLVDDELVIAVQVNGKVRAEFTISRTISKEEVEKQALAHSDIEKWITGKEIVKVIYVPGKLVNIVIK